MIAKTHSQVPAHPQPLALDAAFFLRESGKRIDLFSVVDFWRWGFSNLRENVIRGILAEYIVAQSLGIKMLTRQVWDVTDLTMEDGTTIEVKSGAYMQAWEQKGESNISFKGLKTKGWTPLKGYDRLPDYHADIYVFCVQTAHVQKEYDLLNLDHWEFYVLPRAVLSKTGYASVSLSTVKRFGGVAAGYRGLKDVVRIVQNSEDCLQSKQDTPRS